MRDVRVELCRGLFRAGVVAILTPTPALELKTVLGYYALTVTFAPAAYQLIKALVPDGYFFKDVTTILTLILINRHFIALSFVKL